MSPARTAKVARVPKAANDPKPPQLPPVDTWRKLLAYVRGVKAKGKEAEKSVKQRTLEFIAFVLTKNSGYDDMSSNEIWEFFYETTLNGAPKLTVKYAKSELEEWRAEWKEYNEAEDGPYDLRDELEEYFQ